MQKSLLRKSFLMKMNELSADAPARPRV